ncbi:MAG: type VI secretion system protein TssL, partial [Paraburkholderia graminis]
MNTANRNDPPAGRFDATVIRPQPQAGAGDATRIMPRHAPSRGHEQAASAAPRIELRELMSGVVNPLV